MRLTNQRLGRLVPVSLACVLRTTLYTRLVHESTWRQSTLQVEKYSQMDRDKIVKPGELVDHNKTRHIRPVNKVNGFSCTFQL